MHLTEEPGLHELAARLLNSQRGRRWDQDAIPQVQLLPGQIAADLPLTLPTAADTHIIGSLLHTAEDETTAWTVVLDVSGSPDSLLPVWEGALGKQGWRPLDRHAQFGRSDSGFAAALAAMPHPEPPPEIQAQIARRQATAPTQRLFCAITGTGSLNLTLTPQAGGPTLVRVEVDREGMGPCWMQDQLRESIAARLPRLRPPVGVMLLPGGGGGSDDRWSSEASAMTDQPVAALEAHFAAQLAAAGWTRQAGHAADLLAWSLWAVPGTPAAQGFLYVRVGPGPDQRHLVAQIESVDSAAGGGTTGISFSQRIIGHSAGKSLRKPNSPPSAEPT